MSIQNEVNDFLDQWNNGTDDEKWKQFLTVRRDLLSKHAFVIEIYPQISDKVRQLVKIYDNK